MRVPVIVLTVLGGLLGGAVVVGHFGGVEPVDEWLIEPGEDGSVEFRMVEYDDACERAREDGYGQVESAELLDGVLVLFVCHPGDVFDTPTRVLDPDVLCPGDTVATVGEPGNVVICRPMENPE